jgi:type II secretory pathway component PulM
VTYITDAHYLRSDTSAEIGDVSRKGIMVLPENAWWSNLPEKEKKALMYGLVFMTLVYVMLVLM